MGTATDNLGNTFIVKPDHNKKVTRNQKENYSLNLAMASSGQTLFYIFNTSFLVLVAFVAGYNLKSWQIQKDINSAVKSTEKYIQQTKENYIRSEQLLADLESSGKTHFESTITESPEKNRMGPILDIQPEFDVSPKNLSLLPAQSVKPAVVQKKKNLFKKAIPSIEIRHKIQKGESLSMLVEKTAMNAFLKSNPQISNPDLIYPGQQVTIKIPKQSIKTGSYLNNYFIIPATTASGDATYHLSKSLLIPESDTLLSYIIKQPRQLIGKSTTPYINLSDFTNTMKEEIWKNKSAVQSRKTKISSIRITQTGVHFETIRSHPVFDINSYNGVKSINTIGYFDHIDIIKDFLIKYLASLQPDKSDNLFFHFMIFGETIVQTDFLRASAFNDSPGKSKIIIGIVHTNNQTENALFTLERTLTKCKINKGIMAELSQDNFTQYQR